MEPLTIMADVTEWPDNEEDELELIVYLDAYFEAEEMSHGMELTETQRDWCVVFRPEWVPWLCCPNLVVPVQDLLGGMQSDQEIVDRSWWYTFIRPLLAERGITLHHPRHLCEYPGDNDY